MSWQRWCGLLLWSAFWIIMGVIAITVAVL